MPDQRLPSQPHDITAPRPVPILFTRILCSMIRRMILLACETRATALCNLHRLFKITLLGKWDERGERPFYWPLTSFPGRYTEVVLWRCTKIHLSCISVSHTTIIVVPSSKRVKELVWTRSISLSRQSVRLGSYEVSRRNLRLATASKLY